MVFVSKLKIGDEHSFEEGKNHVKSIKIDDEKGVIKIGFDEDCKWDFKIITLQSVKSLVYNVKTDELKDLEKILKHK